MKQKSVTEETNGPARIEPARITKTESACFNPFRDLMNKPMVKGKSLDQKS